MPEIPTVQSIARRGSKIFGFATPIRIGLYGTTTAVLCSFTSYSLLPGLPSWTYWLLALILIPVFIFIISRFIIPSEFESRRVRDLMEGDLLVYGDSPLGFEALPVLSRLNVDDLSPQVEVVLAGKSVGRVYPPDEVVRIAKPMWLKAPLSEEYMEQEIDSLGDVLEELDPCWPNNENVGDRFRFALNLGLLEKFTFKKGYRWSKSANMIHNHRLYNMSLPYNDQEPEIVIVVNVHGNLYLQVGEQEVDLHEVVDSLFCAAQTNAEKSAIRRIQSDAENRGSSQSRV